MKGVILAGGTGSRLYPLTKTMNKHILPIYDKPMICYPLETLKEAGLEEVLIISGPGHAGQFLELLGSGYDFGLNIKYTIQDKPLGIAHGVWIAQEFADGESIAVILGDNVVEDSLREDIESFSGGAKIFLKEVERPERFGVVDIEDGTVTSLVEKPDTPPTDLAMTGVYLYDEHVFEYADTLELSDRGELEVTDLNRVYLDRDELEHRKLDGYWFDAGTFEGLFTASAKMRDMKMNDEERGLQIVDDS